MKNQYLNHYQKITKNYVQKCQALAQKYPHLIPQLGQSEAYVSNAALQHIIQSAAALDSKLELEMEQHWTSHAEEVIRIHVPYWLRPVPARGIIEIFPEPHLNRSIHVPQGTKIENEQGCRFVTPKPITIHPIHIKKTEFFYKPFPFKEIGGSSIDLAAEVMFKMTFKTNQPNILLSGLKINEISLFLDPNSRDDRYQWFEYLFQNNVSIWIGTEDEPSKWIPFNVKDLLFEDSWPCSSYLLFDESVNRSAQEIGHYFFMPEQFQRLTIANLNIYLNKLNNIENEISIYLFLKKPIMNSNVLTKDDFKLNSVSVINLYDKKYLNRKIILNEAEIDCSSLIEKSQGVYKINLLKISEKTYKNILSQKINWMANEFEKIFYHNRFVVNEIISEKEFLGDLELILFDNKCCQEEGAINFNLVDKIKGIKTNLNFLIFKDMTLDNLDKDKIFLRLNYLKSSLDLNYMRLTEQFKNWISCFIVDNSQEELFSSIQEITFKVVNEQVMLNNKVVFQYIIQLNMVLNQVRFKNFSFKTFTKIIEKILQEKIIDTAFKIAYFYEGEFYRASN